MSRTIKCKHCSKLFVHQQGLFYTVKLKTYNCIVFTDVSTQNYIYPFQNLSLGYILKIFLKFREFQPRYSYKIYSYKKKECNHHHTCSDPSGSSSLNSLQFINVTFSEHVIILFILDRFKFQNSQIGRAGQKN